MPSLVTSIIGGFQSSSASHHAADYLQQGYGQAGQTVTDAANKVNPEILAAAKAAGIDVTDAAKAAGAGVTGAAGDFMKLLAPYLQGGAGAMGQLSDLLAPGGAMSKPFTADMMAQYSPAYQFQLRQGQDAAKQAAAAAGLTGSGGTMTALNRYAQDYAGTAFGNAANLYNQQQQLQFGRLATLAGMGQTAATTGGQAGMAASEYAGDAGMNAAQWAGGQNINAQNLAAQNTLGAANYLANTQIGAKQAQAQGDLGAASAWNKMLGGIGTTGDALLFGGLGASGGWSPSNFGPNLWGGGASGGGGGKYKPSGSFPSPWSYTPSGGIQNPW